MHQGMADSYAISFIHSTVPFAYRSASQRCQILPCETVWCFHGFSLLFFHPEVLKHANWIEKAIRQQLRRAASCIKFLASGGCTSLLDNPEHRQFSDDELHAMLAEAERSERTVSAHRHGKAAIMAALKAGCTLFSSPIPLLATTRCFLLVRRIEIRFILDPDSS